MPHFDGSAWDNPCSTRAVQIASSIGLSGTTAAVMNAPANIATFTSSVETGISAQNGRKVSTWVGQEQCWY